MKCEQSELSEHENTWMLVMVGCTLVFLQCTCEQADRRDRPPTSGPLTKVLVPGTEWGVNFTIIWLVESVDEDVTFRAMLMGKCEMWANNRALAGRNG